MPENNEPIFICRHCKRKVVFNEKKYVKDAPVLFCPTCTGGGMIIWGKDHDIKPEDVVNET